MLDIRPFKHFLAVVNAGSFYKASQELHLSPPALTKSINNLEEDLGVPLFEREYGRATPTAYGQVLIERAQRILDDLDGIKGSMTQMEDLNSGELAIGAGPLTALGVVASTITRLSNEYPKIKISLYVDNVVALADLLKVGKIEMIVGYHEEFSGESELKIQPLFEEPFKPISRVGHPLQSLKNMSMKQMQNYPWVSTFIPRKLRSLYIERLGAGVFENQYRFQCDNFGVIFHLLRNSDYIAFVTDSMVTQELDMGTLAFLPSPFDIGLNSTGVISMSKRSFSPAAHHFCQYLNDYSVDLPGCAI